MVNKNKEALKIAAIVAGTVVGVAAVATGAYLLYKRYIAKKKISCNECELCDECECHGEFFDECCDSEGCLAEELEQNKIKDSESVD